MKKQITLIIVFVMALSLAACGSNKEIEETAATKDIQAEAPAAKEGDAAKKSEGETTTENEKLTVEEPSVEFVEPTAEELEYHYDAAYEGAIITAYNGGAQAIRIPAELDGDPVKRVSFNNSNITHIELPDSVTAIGVFAFGGCPGLRSITIPDSVTRTGKGAFYGCDGLKVTYQGQEYTYANDPSNWWSL